MINSSHPTSLQFKNNERDTLQFIHTRGLFKTLPEIATAVERAYYNCQSTDFKKRHFSFLANFHLFIEGFARKVIVAGHVEGDFEIASYSLSICGRGEDELNLIRKFHFDYAKPTIKRKQPAPLYHLQYGGELGPVLEALNITDTYMNNWLSLPRLNFTPINLALLFDILLNEFQNADILNIIQDSKWRELIRKNEEFLVRQYYKSISEHIFSAKFKQDKLLIRDFFYGNN